MNEKNVSVAVLRSNGNDILFISMDVGSFSELFHLDNNVGTDLSRLPT